MSFDPELDSLLREVPLPDGLVARIQASVGPTDGELDARLQQVEVPAGLLDRLRDIPHDEWTDEKLNEVSVPFEVVWRARRKSIPTRVGLVLRRAADLATAAVLFLAVSGAMFGAAVALIASIFPDAGPPDELPFIVAASPPLAFDSAYEGPELRLVANTSLTTARELPENADHAKAALEVDPPQEPLWPSSGPDVQWISAIKRGVDPLENVVLMRWGILGYPQFEEELTPALESPQLPTAAGVELPAVRGYDRAFAVRHGVFPPVRPAAHRALATLALPLTTASHSFHLARHLVRNGEWPAASQLRTEEFLAAMDYQLPPAMPGQVAIRTAAGPSLFGPPGTGLLQIAALAGELPRGRAARHVVLAIDMSRSMARGQRLDLVQSAVGRLLTHLRPQDRVSLVVFDDELRHVIEGATAAEAGRLRTLLAELRPGGGTDLAQGLQQAAAVALAEQRSDEAAARIVLITDSHVAMPLATESVVTEVLSTAAAGGVQLAVLDVGDQPQADETLQGWAEMMGGELRRPQSIDEAGWLLVEGLYSHTPVVATEVQMAVRFNPKVVAAYRLIGHEANSIGSLQPARQTTDLRASEAATTLLEIWFQAKDEDDVGEVELSWRDAGGREQRRHQRISRIQFASTWEQSPLSLQQAAIAAQTAEVLRGSRTALRELNLVPQEKENFERLLSAAERVHPQLAKRPQFQDFMSLVRDLSRSRGR